MLLLIITELLEADLSTTFYFTIDNPHLFTKLLFTMNITSTNIKGNFNRNLLQQFFIVTIEQAGILSRGTTAKPID